MKKKILALLLLTTILIVSFGTKYAEAEVQPRLPICGNCNKGYLVPSTSYSPWSIYGDQKCTHYLYGLDTLYYRMMTKTGDCNYCLFKYKYSSNREEGYICHGSNTSVTK